MKMLSAFEKIRQAIIGADTPIETPFGIKPMIYADYTASGRSLSFIEDYINLHVLPWYANTHTETSLTGAQSSALREQARDEIRKAVNGSQKDKIIFCGSGATAAINKMIDILGLRATNTPVNHSLTADKSTQKPVVFIGPYEHHSNELPWRESAAEVVCIPLTACGQIDLEVLEEKLQYFADRQLKIGSFSAASNVTGILSKIDVITALLSKYDALSFWDFAAAAPYTQINMNGSTPIDAAFISPHKFIGGPGTPGVLIVKAALVRNPIPTVVGGGTVSYVTPTTHIYNNNIERREEAGTPAIIESVRAGLVFKLQQEVGLDSIRASEKEKVNTAMAFFKSIPNITVLGGAEAERLAIFSLRFGHRSKDLHYGFVTALLNDLFGIQARGGCSCAGPYAHSLLRMSKSYSSAIEKEVTNGNTILRPGWVRLNFNYFISKNEFNYILSALKMVAEHGWRILPFYKIDTKSGNWRYKGVPLTLPISLHQLSLLKKDSTAATSVSNNYAPHYVALLEQAERILLKKRRGDVYPIMLNKQAEALRWFALPQSCYDE